MVNHAGPPSGDSLANGSRGRGAKPWASPTLVPVRPPRRVLRQPWMISFTDLCCLMLSFFILLYAMSEPDRAQLRKLTAGLGVGAVPAANAGASSGAAFVPRLTKPVPAINLDYLAAILDRQLAEDDDLHLATLRRLPDRVAIDLPTSALFDGDGHLSDRGRRMLTRLGGALDRLDNGVEAIGYSAPDADDAGWRKALSQALGLTMALRQTGFVRDITALVAPAGPGTGSSTLAILVRDHDRH
ncbi:MAG: flagellar motor protein MotB [Azospirillaceae bacterium]|nr:flagellar motor protein MotB [Azospirillaceae bacterium]